MKLNAKMNAGDLNMQNPRGDNNHNQTTKTKGLKLKTKVKAGAKPWQDDWLAPV